MMSTLKWAGVGVYLPPSASPGSCNPTSVPVDKSISKGLFLRLPLLGMGISAFLRERGGRWRGEGRVKWEREGEYPKKSVIMCEDGEQSLEEEQSIQYATPFGTEASVPQSRISEGICKGLAERCRTTYKKKLGKPVRYKDNDTLLRWSFPPTHSFISLGGNYCLWMRFLRFTCGSKVMSDTICTLGMRRDKHKVVHFKVRIAVFLLFFMSRHLEKTAISNTFQILCFLWTSNSTWSYVNTVTKAAIANLWVDLDALSISLPLSSKW